MLGTPLNFQTLENFIQCFRQVVGKLRRPLAEGRRAVCQRVEDLAVVVLNVDVEEADVPEHDGEAGRGGRRRVFVDKELTGALADAPENRRRDRLGGREQLGAVQEGGVPLHTAVAEGKVLGNLQTFHLVERFVAQQCAERVVRQMPVWIKQFFHRCTPSFTSSSCSLLRAR